jgi:pilus assembly protein CpaE
MMLWVTDDPEAQRSAVEQAAAQVELRARFCQPAELVALLRLESFALIGVALGIDAQQGVGLLRLVRERLPRTPLLAASPDASLGAMRAALEAGASDVVALPLDHEELARAIVRASRAAVRAPGGDERRGEIVVVFGARGGLGATTLAANFAGQLRAVTAAEVALVDLDLQRGDAGAFLNLAPSQSLATIAEAGSTVDAILVHTTLTRHPSGLFLLAAPEAIEAADGVGAEHVERVLELLRRQFRFTVVDTPRTITEPLLAALHHADRVLVLSDLSVPGLRAARRILSLLPRLEVAEEGIQLVLTRAAASPVDLKDAVRALGREPVTVLPADPGAASEAMNTGVLLDPRRSALGAAIRDLATTVAGVHAAKPRRGRLLQRIFAMEDRT